MVDIEVGLLPKPAGNQSASCELSKCNFNLSYQTSRFMAGVLVSRLPHVSISS